MPKFHVFCGQGEAAKFVQKDVVDSCSIQIRKGMLKEKTCLFASCGNSSQKMHANEEYGSIQWDSTILSVEGDIDRGVKELRRIATRLAWTLRFGRQ